LLLLSVLTFASLHQSRRLYYLLTMKTYVLGIESDRVLTVNKVDGQYVVTIKVKDVDYK